MHQGLVKRSIFQAAKERFDSTPKKLPFDRPREPYKLAKLLECGWCKGRLYAWSQKQNSGWVKKYACFGHKIYGNGRCPHNSVNEKVIVEAIKETIQKALASQGIFSKALLMNLARVLMILDQGSASQVRAMLGELFERIALHFKYSFHSKVTRTHLVRWRHLSKTARDVRDDFARKAFLPRLIVRFRVDTRHRSRERASASKSPWSNSMQLAGIRVQVLNTFATGCHFKTAK